MQVRYQAALHAEAANYNLALPSNREQGADFLQLFVQVTADGHARGQGGHGFVLGGPFGGLGHIVQCRGRSALRLRQLLQAVARTTDGEALFVEQIADAADHQHFVVLVVAPVAAPLDRPQLRELLLPVTQHMRFDTAQLGDFTDGEVALGWDGGQDVVHALSTGKGVSLLQVAQRVIGVEAMCCTHWA